MNIPGTDLFIIRWDIYQTDPDEPSDFPLKPLFIFSDVDCDDCRGTGTYYTSRRDTDGQKCECYQDDKDCPFCGKSVKIGGQIGVDDCRICGEFYEVVRLDCKDGEVVEYERVYGGREYLGEVKMFYIKGIEELVKNERQHRIIV